MSFAAGSPLPAEGYIVGVTPVVHSRVHANKATKAMTPETAFKQFEPTVNADPDRLKDARLRRDAFVGALADEDDITEASAIGSLARKTQQSPLNDIDILAVFDSTGHPDWGSSSTDSTSAEALDEAASRIRDLLGKDGSKLELLNPNGGSDLYVRQARRKRHSVKCFLDKAGETDAFTVDVVPAIRHPERGVWIPERDVDDDSAGTWIRSDPEHLIECAERFQSEWDLWIPVVRALKYWNSECAAGMTSLYVEVIAHTALPRNDSRPRAIARFFQSAEYQVSAELSDPAHLCGAIQPDLDVEHARQCLASAAELAWEAVTAEADGHEDDAVCAWRSIFGNEFPSPPGGCDGSKAAATAAAPALIGVAERQSRNSTPRRVKNSPQG